MNITNSASLNIAGSLSIKVRGGLMDFSVPKVMGILNATPDSFFAGSRAMCAADISRRLEQLRSEGADIVDIGGYSTRPGAEYVSAEEEYRRLAMALEIVRREWSEAVVSVDTFRASVARNCVKDWEADIINDIGGGTLDEEMWQTVADLGVAYVLMHTRGTPQTMGALTDYGNVTAEVLSDLAFKTAELRRMGVADIIIDPGFGFAKTLEQNYSLLANLREFQEIGAPVLAGLSRKTMIWKPLGITPEEAANGTTVLNTIALHNGAHILRVHDVRNAVEAVKLVQLGMRN